jgi:tetratricopeptide (TPR) repeat protein
MKIRRRPRRMLMKRRRPARFWRRPMPQPPPVSTVRDALAQANRLMADGCYAEAAAIFRRVSREAQQHGLIVRAGDLALQAARAWLRAGEIRAALEWARKGIRLLIRGGRADRAERVLSRMAGALRERGYDAQVAELEQEAKNALDQLGASPDQVVQHAVPAPERRGTLPATCSGCGSPLVPDEVEWHSADTAECLYCGSIIKAV